MDKKNKISKEVQAAIELRRYCVEAQHEVFWMAKDHGRRMNKTEKGFFDGYEHKIAELDKYLKELGDML